MSIERFKFRGKATRDWLVTGDEKTPQKGDWITTETMRHSQFFEMVEVGSIDPATVGQFTGLVDSKGMEIWEGDVILGRDSNGYNNPEHYEPTTVCFRNGMFVCDYWGWILDDRCTVIGTIHDKAAV